MIFFTAAGDLPKFPPVRFLTLNLTIPSNTAADGSIVPTQGNAASDFTMLVDAPTPGTAAPCPTCAGRSGSAPITYVYALGRVEPRFPRTSIQKEIAQAIARTDTRGLTDRAALHKVLSDRNNRYLARQLCYALTIEGLETYLLFPRDPVDIDLLVGAIRPAPTSLDMDVVIGMKGPIAPPAICNGLMVPMVVFDQIYSFDRSSLLAAVPLPKGVDKVTFTATAEEVLDRVLQIADNAGATYEHRALNYLALRYPDIYTHTYSYHARNFALTAVDVQPSLLTGTRKIAEVIVSYTNRQNDFVEKQSCRVDVTEEFPFMVTKMAPYYDR